jgi:ADP-ribose pyrophosphatase
MHPCIGYSDERIEIFWAQGLIYVGHQRDHGEHLDVIELSIADACWPCATARSPTARPSPP